MQNTNKQSVSFAVEYGPGGMLMPSRTYVAASPYKYGFNGQEHDDEIYGHGNSYTAEFWQYDPRIGRRWNLDPVVDPSVSSYACFSDSPILYADPDGRYSRLGAMWRNVVNGGNGIYDITLSDGSKDWAYRTTNKNGVGVHNFGPSKAQKELKAATEAYVDNMEFMNTLREAGMNPYITEDVNEARWSWFKFYINATLPNVLSKGTLIINGAEDATNVITQAASRTDELMQAANTIDRGGYTAAGNALKAHADKLGSAFPKPTGNPAAVNAQGEKAVQQILNSKDVIETTRHHGRFGMITDFKLPTGQGARFTADGKKFITFLESKP